MDDRDLTEYLDGKQISRRDALKHGALGTAALASLGGLASLAELTAADAAGAPSAKLVAAAKKEGHLNVITLPRDWAGYGALMDNFQARYKLSITDSIPQGSSAQEISAIQNLKGQSRGPDVVDVSPAKAVEGAASGLFAKYKVSTWKTIPGNMKDPAGQWYGDYWGAIAFISLDSQVKVKPRDWSDLLKPDYKNQVALGGDPTQSGEGFGAVMSASLANGGSLDDIQPGIDYFARLKAAGNWNPTLGNAIANISKGVTPIVIRWDYLLLANRDELKKGGQSSTVSLPKSGRYGGYYAQAISKFAPNPNAARLWQEYLYSDEGQIGFLKGYTHPARYQDLAKRGKIPKSLAKKLPAASNYKGVKFATVAQITKAQTLLAAQWHSKMG